MSIASGQIQFTGEELELLEEINPDLQFRLLGNPTADVPISLSQQRVWLRQQMVRAACHNDSMDLRIRGPLNATCLEAAWNQVVLQNESLRTAIVEIGGEPLQQLMAYCPAELAVQDLSRLEDPLSEATQRCIDLAKTELDLPSADVFRACLFKLADEDHIFHLTVHAIVIDAWSWNILKRELKQFYEAALAGKLGVLYACNKVPYADFARRQRERLDRHNLSRHLSYRKTPSNTAPALLELPTDFPRPARPTSRGSRERLAFDSALTATLKQFGRQQDVPLLTLLLAGFKALLWRYTGCQDVVVGTAVPNRVSLEHRDIVGCFSDVRPFRTKISSDMTVKELLERVQKVVTCAFDHQELAFEKTNEEFQPEREQNPNRYVDVALILQHEPAKISRIADLNVIELEFDYGLSKFDLSINLSETAEGLSGWLEYSTDLFAADRARRIASHYGVILREFLQWPERRLSDLTILTPSERNEVVVEWNRTETDFPRDKCVHQLFEQQVRENPEADAVTFKHTTWTYRELNERADGVAWRLREAGISPGRLVGVCVERSADMVAVLLGVWKAAYAYVPLDPSHPPHRIIDVCLDARVSLVITNKDFAANFAATPLRLLLVEEIGDVSSQGAKAQLPFSSEDLAYVIYTSGSTGKPKGVQIRHRSVTNMLTAFARIGLSTKNDYFTAVTTITFDIAALELFLPLTTGAQVIVVEREVIVDAVKLAKIAERATTTVMQATPATWRMLLEAGWRGNPHLTVLCGGEALTENLAQQLLQRAKAVWNLYGPTEATVWCTVWRMQKGMRISIGKPFDNLQAYILDEHLQSVPVGVIGELHIGGEGLAAGYLNRPELTAEKFVSNPFKRESIIYKTGDRARYMPDGNIECLGRIDHQLKIRGYRIEPGEIEAILVQHPAVRQAVVVGAEDVSGTKCLVAFLVETGQGEIDSNGLIRFLQSKVPAYMIPAQFVFIDKIPLNSSGKIDRNQLFQLRHRTNAA